MPPHPLTNFVIQKYYQNESKVNGVYLKYNLHKITDGAYVINLDKFSSMGNHWIALYVNGNKEPTLTALELSTFQKKLKHL